MAEQPDEQRAAEERVLELCDMDYERAAATAAEFDRLRAELAETRAAGDALAFAVAPIERMGRGAPGSRLDVLITRAEEWRSVRGDAPAPAEPPVPLSVQLTRGSMAAFHEQNIAAPAVELPVTLSSVDDVAAVCAFLDMSQVRERTWYCNPQVTVWAAGTCDEGAGGVEIDSVPLHLDVQFPASTSLVVAAIEAARGETR